MKKTGYNTGDRVVLQPYGVGVVCGIATQGFSSGAGSYYQVEFPNSNSKAYVPVGTPVGTAMRPALTLLELPELRYRLLESCCELPRQWSARARRVGELIGGGDPFEIATLACELRRWHLEKGLADLDRQAYRRCLKLLLSEVRQLEGGGNTLEVVSEWLESAWAEVSN